MNYITTTQAATALDVSVRTVYRYLKSGRLQGDKADGMHWRIPESSLDSCSAQGSQIPDAGSTPPKKHSMTPEELRSRLLPGEEDFISWITQKKQENDKAGA